MSGGRIRETGEAKEPRKKSRFGLAEKVLVGLVLGLAVGVFFGEMAGFLKIAGDAFIMLLQITVIPYIMVSLITALGRLSIEDTKSLGLKAGGILLVLWGVGLAVVLVTPLAFPEWPSASFFSTSQVEETRIRSTSTLAFFRASTQSILFCIASFRLRRDFGTG